MWRRVLIAFGVTLSLVAVAWAEDLATATPEALKAAYQNLRNLKTGGGWVEVKDFTLKRDAATFTFTEGRLSFAAPVAGQVVALCFEGRGRFILEAPTGIHKAQLLRFCGSPLAMDTFQRATLFFTDDTWSTLSGKLQIQPGAAPNAPVDPFVSSIKKMADNFNDWIDNARKGHPNMRNLCARMLADLADSSSKGLFLADFQAEHWGDMLLQISWNRDSIILPELPNDEEVMLVRCTPGYDSEWWAGFHLAEEYRTNPKPEHRQPMIHCREDHLDVNISNANTLTVTADLDAELPIGSPRVLPLMLNGLLRIQKVTDGSGTALVFIQEDPKRDCDPWVILPAPARSGQPLKLTLTYREEPQGENRIILTRGSGLYYVAARDTWFPSFGPDDRTRFFLRLHCPKRFTMIATGRLAGSETKGDVLETRWESDLPYCVTGFNYGDFVQKSHKDDKLAVNAYSGKEPPDVLKNIKGTMTAAELSLGRDHGNAVENQTGILSAGLETTRMLGFAADMSYQAMKLDEFFFGPLPFNTVSVTQQPSFGSGQSWPTLIFLPFDSLMDSTTRNSLGFQETIEERMFYNTVAVHEMAHQWWGHLVGWKTYHDQWLSEGIAEFATALFIGSTEPKKWDSFWTLKHKSLLVADTYGQKAAEAGPLWLGPQVDRSGKPHVSRPLLYHKGAYVMEMLHQLMKQPREKDPDARFFGMLKDFVTTFTGRNASTEDFRKIVEKHAGEPMDWFFDAWVYGSAVPQYDFKYELTPGDGGKTVLRFSLTQSKVPDTFTMRVPFYVEVNGGLRRLGFFTVQGNKTESGEIPLPFKPERVAIDVSHCIPGVINQ